MNAQAIARHYDHLTPQERFRLIPAASGHADHAERDRLGRCGPHIMMQMSDHVPYAQAFLELAFMTYIELQEGATVYADAFARDCAALDPAKNPLNERTFDLTLATGYVMRTKANGWKAFCQRLSVPPFLLWEGFPGFHRLQQALTTAERRAFTSEGVLRWLNRMRPEGKPIVNEEDLLTVEKLADDHEATFETRRMVGLLSPYFSPARIRTDERQSTGPTVPSAHHLGTHTAVAGRPPPER